MEAANLGAYAAPFDDEMLTESLELLAKAPHFTPSITQWASAAFEVRARWPQGGRSVGIPTWFYGHEPPNPFASHIAKYFANATREDGLLARSNAGVVFLPGAAGTVQEIFDNATPNYYESRGEPTPDGAREPRALDGEAADVAAAPGRSRQGAFDGGPDRAGRPDRGGAGGVETSRWLIRRQSKCLQAAYALTLLMRRL